MVNSVEFTEGGNNSDNILQMPTGAFDHSMTVTKNGNIFVQYNVLCCLYEIDKKQWTRCPNMPTSRNRASCGVAVRGDGQEVIVVAGGISDYGVVDIVEVYNPVGNGSWTTGKNN